MRLKTKLRIGLAVSLILLAFYSCILFFWAYSTMRVDDSKPQNILPTPFYTNNHGQSFILLRRSKLESWLKAHPNAKIISIGVTRLGEHTIVYEEVETEIR